MVATAPRPTTATVVEKYVRPAFIDCDHHNQIDTVKDLYPYLSKAWVDHIETFGTRGPTGGMYPRFQDDVQAAWPPSGRRAGSEAWYVKKHFLDPENCAYAVLTPLTGVGGTLNQELGAALATAWNDWQIAEWLEYDDRFRASIIIPFEDAAASVAEIKRVTDRDKRFVQVQFSGRPHEPMGRRKYWPIYEACAERGLHVMSHAFGSFGQPITGTGWPSFYVDEHVNPAQSMQGNITSFVVEGVFDKFPNVHLVSAENGFAWLPSLGWRLDAAWKLLKAETPHLTRAPSEYLAEHVFLCTQPMEEPHKPKQFWQMLEHYAEAADNIVFASDYPHWDADDPDDAFPVSLPPELAQKIYFDNAAKLYRLG